MFVCMSVISIFPVRRIAARCREIVSARFAVYACTITEAFPPENFTVRGMSGG